MQSITKVINPEYVYICDKDVEIHKKKGMDWVMNGINYSALFGNTTLFPQTNKTNSKLKGQVSGVQNGKNSKEKLETRADSYSKSQEMKKVTYEKPVVKKPSNLKNVDNDGIQEGVTLSDDAKKLLAQLREKYSNMEFRVAHWSTDEEEEYYASKCEKQFSVLIDPEALEAMTKDEAVKEKYLSALDQAGNQAKQLKEELGEDYSKVESFTISINQDGKISYTAKLIEDFASQNKNNAVSIKERLEKKKEAEKENEKLQNKKQETTKIKKDTLQELIQAIKDTIQG